MNNQPPCRNVQGDPSDPSHGHPLLPQKSRVLTQSSDINLDHSYAPLKYTEVLSKEKKSQRLYPTYLAVYKANGRSTRSTPFLMPTGKV